MALALSPFAASLTKNQRSILVYAETCLVDKSGLLSGERMNRQDLDDLDMFQAESYLRYGRIKLDLIPPRSGADHFTHWVIFNPRAWALASELRQLRAEQRSPAAVAIFKEVESRQA